MSLVSTQISRPRRSDDPRRAVLANRADFQLHRVSQKVKLLTSLVSVLPASEEN